VLVAPGVAGAAIDQVQAALAGAGAVPRLVGPHIGAMATAEGQALDADASLENEPGFLFDALVLPDGEEAVAALARDGHTMEFIKDQYRHCKTILALGASARLLEQAGIVATPGDTAKGKKGGAADPGLIVQAAGDTAVALDRFIQAMARHRHFERETDPPAV
jgi:catalase